MIANRTVSYLIFLVVALVLHAWVTPVPAQQLATTPGFEKALKRAQTERKPILLVFLAPWAFPPHRAMMKKTLSDAAVQAWTKKHAIMVAASVDAKKSHPLVGRYAIKGIPTIVFLKPDGTEFDRLTATITKKQFLAFGEGALAAVKQKQEIKKAEVKTARSKASQSAGIYGLQGLINFDVLEGARYDPKSGKLTLRARSAIFVCRQDVK